MSTTTKKDYQFETKHIIPSYEELKNLSIVNQYQKISIKFNVYEYDSKNLVFFMILEVIGVCVDEYQYEIKDIVVTDYKKNVEKEIIESILEQFIQKKYFVETFLSESILESYTDLIYENIIYIIKKLFFIG